MLTARGGGGGGGSMRGGLFEFLALLCAFLMGFYEFRDQISVTIFC